MFIRIRGGYLKKWFISLSLALCLSSCFVVTPVYGAPQDGAHRDGAPSNAFNRDKSWSSFVQALKFGVLVGTAALISISLYDYFSRISSRNSKFSKNNNSNVTFDDVIGMDNALIEVQEYVDFLLDPNMYLKVGAQRPKGLLLHGPPGCGKTLLAKAIAGEADCYFIESSGSEFVEIYVGMGPARVRHLFDQARRLAKTKPVILFIDEIDSIGQRSLDSSGGSHEYNNTINELLRQMDGFTPTENILVVGATNLLKNIDEALLRPGRFDRKVYVQLPDVESRKDISKYYANNLTLSQACSSDEFFDDLAKKTPGFSGADIKNLINEAAILAGRNMAEEVDVAHFDEALEKIVLGLRKNTKQTKEQLEKTAYHEAGHTLVAALYDIPLNKVSIVPRDNTLGVTWMPQKHESLSHYLRDEILYIVQVSYGGFAAEELVYGNSTPGVVGDLEGAGELVSRMVKECGMGNGDLKAIPRSAVENGEKFDDEIMSILKSSFEKSKELIKSHRSSLDELAKELLKKEELNKEEIYEILGELRGAELLKDGTHVNNDEVFHDTDNSIEKEIFEKNIFTVS